MLDSKGGVLPLTSLNHISIVCRSVETSLAFYRDVLGFVPVRRPGSFNFSGAWLFNYGVGIHLLQSEDPENMKKKTVINPRDNHISFQCENMASLEKKLKEMGIDYVARRIEDGGIYVDQMFFHDPDGFMIEICDCDNLPVVPLAGVGEPAAPCKAVGAGLMQQQQQQQQQAMMVQCHCPTIHCENMASLEKKLKEMGIDYVARRIEEGGIYVDQMFFHDPDGFMIEICDCDNLPVVPLAGVGEPAAPCKTVGVGLMQQQQQQQQAMMVQCHCPTIHVSGDSSHNIPCA